MFKGKIKSELIKMKCSRSITSAAEIGQLPYACVCLRGIFCLYIRMCV